MAVEFTMRHIPGVTDPLGPPVRLLRAVRDLARPATIRRCATILESGAGATPWRDGLVLDAVLAESLAQRNALWRLRESVPEAQRAKGASIKHDVSVPVAALPDFMAQATAAVLAIVPTGRMVAYGHVGDGNLHFNVSEPARRRSRLRSSRRSRDPGRACTPSSGDSAAASVPSTASVASSATRWPVTRVRWPSRRCGPSSARSTRKAS